MWEDCITPAQMFTQKRRRNFYSRCSIVPATAMSWRRCVSPNMVRGVTFPSHTWGIRPITTHSIAGQSEHTSLFRTMSFVKIYAFQKAGAERSNNNMWKIMCFLDLKPYKHIALHQIHKIMFFLAMSNDPFNYWIIYHANVDSSLIGTLLDSLLQGY